jgi:hypothetical protein
MLRRGDVKMKKQALLIALTSALALGAVTTSFAQGAPDPNSGSYYGSNGTFNNSGPNGTGQDYVPGYGNTGAGSGPSGE